MQQSVPSGDVFRPSASVVLGGVSVDASSVSVDRELPDPLTGGTLSAAEGRVVGVSGGDVSPRVPTPWDPGSWPPSPEAPARVALNVGPGEVQTLTGRVQEVSGGVSGREVEVGVSDLYRTLDRDISWPELSDAMPSPDEGGAVRFIGLHSTAITDRIFRHCGWYATPPLIGYTTFSVPAMGTMEPEVGVLDTCDAYQHPNNGAYPFFNGSSWGQGVNRVNATYNFASYTLASRGHLEMTAMMDDVTGAEDRSSMAFRVDTASGRRLSLAWSPSSVNVWVTSPAGAQVLAAQGSYVPGALAYVKIDRLSSTSIRCELRIGGSVVDTRTVSVHSQFVSQGFNRAQIVGDMMGGGFQLAYPGSTAHSLDNWSSSAIIHRAPTSHMLKFRPVVMGQNCVDLLNQQCEAQGATYWIDEHGVLQWWDLQTLESRGDEFSINADDHVAEGGFSWQHDLSSVKSRVVVKWKDYSLTHSLWSRITFWEGRGETMSDGDVVEDFITCPDEEVWIQPDLLFTRLGDHAGPGGAAGADFNRGRRSWWGGVVSDGDAWAYTGGNGYLSFTIERITGVTFKYRMTRTGAQDAEIKSPSPSATTYVSRNKRSVNLPILRGKMKYTLTDMDYVAAQTGPPTAPEHVIDAGWWIQEEEQAKRIADYAASRLCVPHPELSAVSLVMIPGVQLGDIVTLTDRAVSRLTIRGMVVGDSRSLNASMDAAHSIAIRPISVTRNGVTWEDWGEFMESAQYQQWGGSQSGNTWSQWAANPLE